MPRRTGRIASSLLVMAAGLFAWLSGEPPATAELVEVSAQRARCDDFDLDSLASGLGRLHGLLVLPRARSLSIGGRSIPAATYAQRTVLPLLEAAGSGDRQRVCDLVATMSWWRGSPLAANKLLFSAYYTPIVEGSLVKDARFRYPLYRRPPDATRHDTGQIVGGALEGRGLELVWLEEPYDALALQVEGSAQIRLPDGSIFAVGTDGHNGRPYTNVSKLLADDGRLPKGPPPPTTKPGNPKARAFFAAHPDQLRVYWARNPHYVFWKRVQGAGGGKLGMLTGGRSLAVDPTIYPLGSILLTRPLRGFPGGNGTPARLAIAMDTGAAIKGPGRIDVYFGDDGVTSEQAVAQGSVEGEAYVLVGR